MSLAFLIRRNLMRARLRTFLLMLTTLLAFAIYGALSVYGRSFDLALGPWAENRLTTVSKVSYMRRLPASYVERVSKVEGVRDLSYASWFGGYAVHPRNLVDTYAVQPESWLRLYREWVVTDEARACLLRERAGLISGEALARRMGWRTGERVTLSSLAHSHADGSNEWTFRLCGIFRGHSPLVMTTWAILRHDYLQAETGGPPQVGVISFATPSPEANARIAAAVDELFVNSPEATTTVTANGFAQSYFNERFDFRLVILLVTAAGFMTLLLIVGNEMVMAMRERGREFAILRALGFSRSRIFRLVVGETMTLLLCGGLIGLVLGYLLVAATGFPRASMAYSTLLPAVLLMIALGLAVGLFPALRASRTSIATLTRE